MEDELIVQGLYKKIKRQEILHEISFCVKAGEIVGFVGPNGAGKSTTMKCIAGLYRATKGDIRIHDYDLKNEERQALRHLGVSIEEPALYPSLTGYEHFQLIKGWKKLSSQRIEELQEFSGLKSALKRRTAQYSMGMKQRLILSLALAQNPSLLLLDEPTNGLDPKAVFDLRKKLEAVRKQGCGMLISSHQLDELQKISDRFLFIENGRIISQITKKDMDQMDLNYSFTVQDASFFSMQMKEFPAITVRCQNRVGIKFCDQNELAMFIQISQKRNLLLYDIRKEQITLEGFYRKMYGEK